MLRIRNGNVEPLRRNCYAVRRSKQGFREFFGMDFFSTPPVPWNIVLEIKWLQHSREHCFCEGRLLHELDENAWTESLTIFCFWFVLFIFKSIIRSPKNFQNNFFSFMDNEKKTINTPFSNQRVATQLSEQSHQNICQHVLIASLTSNWTRSNLREKQLQKNQVMQNLTNQCSTTVDTNEVKLTIYCVSASYWIYTQALSRPMKDLTAATVHARQKSNVLPTLRWICCPA